MRVRTSGTKAGTDASPAFFAQIAASRDRSPRSRGRDTRSASRRASLPLISPCLSRSPAGILGEFNPRRGRRRRRGSRRKKTRATEESASAWPAPRGSWARPGISCARPPARAPPRSRARPWLSARRVLCRGLSRATRARCAPRRTCATTHERATPRSVRPTGACASTGLRGATRDRPRVARARRACGQARPGCAPAARAAAGPAREAWAASSHLGDNGSHYLRALDAELLADLRLDLGGELGVFLEVVAGVVLALADAVLFVLVPGAGLVDHAAADPQLQDLAFERYPFAVENVEQRLAERRRHLVLHDLHSGLRTDDLVAALDAADAPDVEAARRVELERVAARGRLGVAEHDTDLHADLVDEDDQRIGTLDVRGELAQCLAHKPRLQAHLRLAHLALDLGLRGKRRYRIDHDHVDRPRAHQHVGDFQRLLAGIGLGNQQLVDLDAQLRGVLGIERILRVDKGRRATHLLRLGDH